MNDPWWIIRWHAEERPIMLLSEKADGSLAWVVFGILFPANEKYPQDLKLAHWRSKEEADSVAFQLVARTPALLGKVVVETCWAKRCKRCFDCLCGEGNRRRE